MLSARFVDFVFLLASLGSISALDLKQVYTWHGTTVKTITPENQPVLFCYVPQSPTKTFFKTWTSVKFFVNDAKDFSIYAGDNETHVFYQYERTAKSWFQVFPYWTQRTVYINPFNKSCVGVACSTQFVANLIVKAFDWRMFLCFVSGIVLFLLAPILSRNFLFHYGSGIVFGVLTSLLILIFVVSRFIPKRNLFYTILFAAFSLSAYLWNHLYNNFFHLVECYHWLFMGYVLASGLISFGYCFYKGPIINPRLFMVMQWVIQIIAMLMMYFGSQVKEVVVISIMLLFLVRHSRLPFPWYFGGVWYRMFPPKPTLLTEEEFHNQGQEETEKALKELREFCRSPKCDAWNTISRLHSPTRFSRWVEGNSDHIESKEISEHEISYDGYSDGGYDDYD